MARRPDETVLMNDGEDQDVLIDETETLAMSTSSQRARKNAQQQTFLVGPTIYLRPLELADAAISGFWKRNAWPTPADIVEERLKESVPAAAASDSRVLIACRRSDNFPTGSIEISIEYGRLARLVPHVPEVFGNGRASEIISEMIRLVVPWLIHEHDQMTVTVLLASGDPLTSRAARTAGMTIAYTLREAEHDRDGGRRDLECWQALHPTWLSKLGKPAEAVFGNVVRAVRSPARRTYRGRSQDPPANATIVGERIFLRPIEQADSDEIARWSMREVDTAFDIGRGARSPISYWHWNRKNAESDPPGWIRFAICLLSDQSVIGANGLAFIDWVHRTAETETEIVRPDYRGSGYGTEAKHLLLEFAFERIGLHMVRSMAWAFNTRSCDALRKQGYRDAGRLAWTGIKSGEFADDLVFDLTAEEWRTARI